MGAKGQTLKGISKEYGLWWRTERRPLRVDVHEYHGPDKKD